MKMRYLKFILMFLISTTMATAQSVSSLKGRLYSDGSPVQINIKDGNISDVIHLPEDSTISRAYLAPGLIDIQVNGYMGVDFTGDGLTVEKIRKVARALWKEGITTFVPTVITAGDQRLKTNFAILAEALNDPEIKRSIPGFHLEGPYISPVKGYRGAHLGKYIRPPDWDEFMQYQQAANKGIKLITVAPEIEGAIPFIRKAVESGVVVSLGHHNGTAGDIQRAVDAGATLCTHLGNGCANMINRHHNPLWPQLSEDRLSISIIVDGFHLTKEEVRTFYKVKGPEKTILISDMLDLAGLKPGEYIRGERRVVLTPHVIKFPEENVLAGAASTLRMDVGKMMKFTGCSLHNAITMASTNPANLLGLEKTGALIPGYRANIILFTIRNGEIIILKTYVDGIECYEAKESANL